MHDVVLAFLEKLFLVKIHKVTFIFLIILLIILITSIVASYNIKFVYAVPFCLVPILIRVFFDSRTSLFNFLNIILLCAFFVPDKFEFVFLQLITGIGTIFSMADMGKRSKLFMSTLLTFVFYMFSYIAYHLVNVILHKPLVKFKIIFALISSVCVLFSFPLIYILKNFLVYVRLYSIRIVRFKLSLIASIVSKNTRHLSAFITSSKELSEELCYKIGGKSSISENWRHVS